MKENLTIFLQIVIVFIGINVLAFMFLEPHLEGRNVDATNFEIYFKDPFLAYVYTASIAFFVVLYQTFKLWGHIRRNEMSSQSFIKALRTIKHCAIILIVFLVGAEGYINIVRRRAGDDIAGGVMIGIVMIFISVVVAKIAVTFERYYKITKPPPF